MKILVLGAGALGGYYGARLIEAGADVTFLVRPGRRTVLEQHGLRVDSDTGAFARPVALVGEGSAGGPFDLVLLTCKSYDLEEAMRAIAPAVDHGASVLPLLNGLSPYDALDARVGRDKVLGGVAYVAATLGKDGIIRQSGTRDVLAVGARSPKSEALAAAFFALVEKTPCVRKLSPSIDQALWNKWVMLASGASMCCLMRGTLRQILATKAGDALMRRQINECADTAAASGFPMDHEALKETRAFLLNRESDWAPSIARDIAEGRDRIEADAIVGDMLARAGKVGVAALMTAAGYAHLQVYMAKATSKT
jgi:2-dehydropantoate 2-reductase